MGTEGWRRVSLGEVLAQDKKYVYALEDREYPKLSVKLYGKGCVTDGVVLGSDVRMKRHQLATAGQVILSEIWGKKGAIGFVPDDGAGALVTSHFFLFDLDETNIDRRWLGWLIKGNYFEAKLSGLARGTTGYAAIRPKQFLEVMIPLPPLHEQRRVVARIEALAERIEKASTMQQEALATAEALFESVVNSAFEPVNSTNCRPLVEVTSKIGSGSTPKGGRGVYPSSGIPFLRSLNVRMRRIQWDGLAHIDEITHQAMKNTHVKADDVLLNITGASIGRTACVPASVIAANVSQHVSIIRPLPVLDSRYLMYWLSQPLLQDLIMSQQKGATRQALTKAQIEAFAVPVLPLVEQRRMVAYLDCLQERIGALQQNQEATSAELEALMPSVLDKAFRGEL